MSSAMRPPSQFLVHLALFCGQAVNGGGSVVAKLGFPTVNPVAFAFFRELCAAPILLALARYHDGPLRLDLRNLAPSLALGTFSMFLGQFLYTVGLKISSPVLGAAWQPSQPIITLAFAVMLGWEALTVPKILGMLCTLVGGVGMTFMDPGANAGAGSFLEDVVSNLIFFVNCLSTAVFVLTMRSISARIPAFSAVALLYLGVTLTLFLVTLLVNACPPVQRFFCSDCSGGVWTFPGGTLLALAYWVIGPSVFSYLCLSFGTRYARNPSHCLMYSTVQPVVSGLLVALLIAMGWNERHPGVALKQLTLGQLVGAGFVMVGIACVAAGAHQQGDAATAGADPARATLDAADTIAGHFPDCGALVHAEVGIGHLATGQGERGGI